MKKIVAAFGVVALVGVVYWFYSNRPAPVAPLPPPPPPVVEKVQPQVEEIEVVEKPKPKPKPKPVVKKTKPKKKKPKKPKVVKKPPVVKPPPEMVPPPVKIYKELIPENIEIVRVYYSSDFTGPGQSIEFDINGSGFTKEFEGMIKVESGHPNVKVADLKLLTLNQIHGRLIVGPETPTTVVFPQVLIQNKVVFRAPQPFAVIRPGEVLNLMFTQMGESGRSGRFRVFTNLTPEMYKKFTIRSSTRMVQISNFTPKLPFIVDAGIEIGPVPTGAYGIIVELDGKTIWKKDGIVRIVRPNVGDTGLVQRVIPIDGFHRPGDVARFSIQGSGFRPRDADLLKAKVKGMEEAKSNFAYFAPGRMELILQIPKKTKEGAYAISISQGETEILSTPNLFKIVPKNWVRSIKVDPPLKPGASGKLVLEGRDLDRKFISKIKTKVDESKLSVGSFKFENNTRATANISAEATLAPGDYWLKMNTDKAPVKPQFGSIIRITQ